LHNPKDTAFSLCEYSFGNAYFYVTSSGVLSLLIKSTSYASLLRESTGMNWKKIYLFITVLITGDPLYLYVK
jgi:hypothetical protein